MNLSNDRRAFLTQAPVIGAGALAFLGATRHSFAADTATPAPTSAPPGFPQQDPELVRGIVGASHGNEERVRELIGIQPELAKSAWDWGFGDWETALGAASHTGRRAIAEVLIEHGARPNLFTYAMLGHVDVVKACIEAQPGVQRVPGPHGITLMRHARSGGAEAEDVVSYLEEVGGADESPRNDPLTAEERAAHAGTFRFGRAENDIFEVIDLRESLWIAPGGTPRRGLSNQGDGVFLPAGAPSVRITFEFDDGVASAVTVAVGQDRLRGVREG